MNIHTYYTSTFTFLYIFYNLFIVFFLSFFFLFLAPYPLFFYILSFFFWIVTTVSSLVSFFDSIFSFSNEDILSFYHSNIAPFSHSLSDSLSIVPLFRQSIESDKWVFPFFSASDQIFPACIINRTAVTRTVQVSISSSCYFRLFRTKVLCTAFL